MKTCINCGCDLTSESWAPDQQANYINKCRECIKAEKREYQKAWRERNPGMSAARCKKSKDKLRTDDPVRSRAQAAYGDCRKRAIKQGMAFDLTPAIVITLMRKSSVCPYLGCELTFSQGEKQNTLASIDRIDSSRGYTLDNVQVISYLANLMKSHATEEELIRFANGVLNLASK